MEYLEPWIPHLSALGGLLGGAAFTWFVWRGKVNLLRARYQERCKAAEKSIVDLEAGCANLEAEVRQLRHTEAVSLKRQAELEVLARTQLQAVEEKQQLLREAEQRLANHFKALSLETLRTTQDEFLKLARSTFDTRQQESMSEFEQRRIAVETLVRPVAATLDKVESRIIDLEKARKEGESALNEQVRQMTAAQLGLQKETAQLAHALRQPLGRGRWGEIQLKRVVELTGMQPHCDFIETAAEPTSESPHRPDLIVNLPTGRQIAVDARAPLDAGLEALEATDEETRAAARKRHAEKVAAHLEELASSAYGEQFVKRPEFIVLFLPSESFLSAVLFEDASLMERGIEQGVLFATPTTLIALLRAAAAGWRQEDIAERARNVSEVGRELYARVSALAGHVARVGQSLDTTVRHFNETIGSLEGEVAPSARRLSDLGVVPATVELPSSRLVERAVRQPRGDLSRLPLANRMDSMAATGELPDDSFEGFAGPAREAATRSEQPDQAAPKPDCPSTDKDADNDAKASAEAKGTRATSAALKSKPTDANAAADDLRAALNKERQAV